MGIRPLRRGIILITPEWTSEREMIMSTKLKVEVWRRQRFFVVYISLYTLIPKSSPSPRHQHPS